MDLDKLLYILLALFWLFASFRKKKQQKEEENQPGPELELPWDDPSYGMEEEKPEPVPAPEPLNSPEPRPVVARSQTLQERPMDGSKSASTQIETPAWEQEQFGQPIAESRPDSWEPMKREGAYLKKKEREKKAGIKTQFSPELQEVDEFDLRRAIVYDAIMRRPYTEEQGA